jgi:hypothetical protein
MTKPLYQVFTTLATRVESLYAGRNGLIYLVDSHDGKVLVFGESRSR